MINKLLAANYGNSVNTWANTLVTRIKVHNGSFIAKSFTGRISALTFTHHRPAHINPSRPAGFLVHQLLLLQVDDEASRMISPVFSDLVPLLLLNALLSGLKIRIHLTVYVAYSQDLTNML